VSALRPAPTVIDDVAARAHAARARRSLIALFAATFTALTGLFLFGPLLLFTLKARGLDTAAVGAFAALQWVGLLVATPFASSWMQRLGPRRALLASGAVPLVALAGMLVWHSLPVWSLLYFVAGMASALRWILAEATVAELAPKHRRGRVMGLFAMMIGVTFMVGPALLSALLSAGWDTQDVGWVAVALVALGLLLLVPVRPPPAAPASASSARSGWRGTLGALRAAPLVMLTGFVGGFFESGLASTLPLYGLTVGFSAASSALLVSVSGLGSTLLAPLAGELADRLSTSRVRQACALVCLLATLGLLAVPRWGALAWPIAFCWGGAGAALYTLAMVDIGHRHQGVALVNSTAVLVMAYTAGGMLAPAAGGAMLQWAPAFGFPALLAAVALLGWWPVAPALLDTIGARQGQTGNRD
jgi:MFS family permease